MNDGMKRKYVFAFIHSFFYKHMGKLGWSSICLRFYKFEPEIMLDGMLNFKTYLWSDIVVDMNTAMVSFKYLNLKIQLSLTWTLKWSLLTFEILWVA